LTSSIALLFLSPGYCIEASFDHFQKIIFRDGGFRIFKAHLLKFQRSTLFVSSDYVDMHYFNAIVLFTSASIGQFDHFQKIIFWDG
jgi:hypothetical protein